MPETEPAGRPRPPLTLVMPVYHEQDNVGKTLAEIARTVKTPHTTWVVYDKDDDPTVPVVERLLPNYPDVRLLKNDLGRGVLNAIRKGFAQVPEDGLVLVVMADLSDDLAQVDLMYRRIADDGWDLVCGSRYMRGGKQIGGPPWKGFLSRLAGVTLNALAGLPTRDGTNAFRMYRATVLREIPIESKGGFELSLELTVKAWRAGFRVTEVPSVWRDRTAGESRFKFREWLPSYIKWYLLAYARLRPGERRPRSR